MDWPGIIAVDIEESGHKEKFRTWNKDPQASSNIIIHQESIW